MRATGRSGSGPQRRSRGWAGRLARLVFLLYPRDFRGRYGQEIRDLHARLGREREGIAPSPTRGLLRVALEAFRHGPASRLEALRRVRDRRANARRDRGADALGLDLRRVFRRFARRPMASGLLVATLALGIGATTAIFSVSEQVLLRPLPFAEPERLVRFMNVGADGVEVDGTIAYLDLFDWHERSHAFEGVVAYDEWWPILSSTGGAERVVAATVSANYFELLGLTPVAGRFFLPSEDVDGNDTVVVISHSLWSQRFARGGHAIGATLELNGRAHQVVGVAPPFDDPGLAGLGEVPLLWRPNGYGGLGLDRLPNRGSESWAGLGRLKEGVTLDQAKLEVANVAAALQSEFPESNSRRGATLVRLHDQIVGDLRPSLILLGTAVALLFLVALVNVVGLLLGRAAERAHETALSRALGAGRWSLLRLGMVEGLVLAGLGCLLGLPCAWLGTQLLADLAAHVLPRSVEVSLDPRPILFAAGLSVVAGVACGALPTLVAVRSKVGTALRTGAAALAGSRSSARARAGLVVLEVAMSVVLLFGATQFGAGFMNLLDVDPGIATENVLTFRVTAPRSSYPERADLESIYDRLQERVWALPGVQAVGVTNVLPFSGSFDGNGVWAMDWPELTLENEVSAQTRSVSPGFFKAIGVALEEGSFFGTVTEEEEPVAVISRQLADRLWPQGEAVGRRLLTSADEDRPARVVGVIRDVKHLSLDEEAEAQVFLARAQGVVPWQLRSASVVVRASVDPLAPESGLVSAVRGAVRSVDPGIPISEVRTMSQWVDRSVSSPRLRSMLTLVFGVAALILTGMGIYSVISSAVTFRRRELAIRFALGAQRSRVAGGVLSQTFLLVAQGLLLGGFGAWMLRGVVSSFVYGVDLIDPLSTVGLPVGLLVVAALAASLSPAMRASRVAPSATLKEV